MRQSISEFQASIVSDSINEQTIKEKNKFKGSSFLSYENNKKSVFSNKKTVSNLDESCIYEEELESEGDEEEIIEDLKNSIDESTPVSDLIIKNFSNLKPR